MKHPRALATIVSALLAPPAWAQTQTAILVPADGTPGDLFGLEVDLEGDVALVGAPGARNGLPIIDVTTQDPPLAEGAVYVFEHSASGWIEVQKLEALDSRPGDGFGSAVAMEGNWAVILAGGTDAAYLFERTPAGWVERQKVAGGYGGDVSIDDSRVMVGAPHSGTIGRITVLEESGGTWASVASFDAFAGSLALDSDRVLARPIHERGVQAPKIAG